MADEAQSLREKLSQELGTSDWSLLAPHAKSERLIVVGSAVVLLDAAVAVAENDANKVNAWIENGKLTKLTPDEQTELTEGEAAFFQFVIIAPFVLAQRMLLAPEAN